MKPQRENEVTQNFLGLREGLGAFEDGVGNRNPRLVPMQHVGMGLWVGFGRNSGGNESGASLPAPHRDVHAKSAKKIPMLPAFKGLAMHS